MKQRRHGPPKPTMTPQDFIVQVSEALDKLMVGFLKDFKESKVEFNEDEADELITLIVNQWCEQEEPDYESNLKMCAAVYLLAVLDCLYGDEIEPNKDYIPPEPKQQRAGATVIDLGIDISKTIRSVFGKEI